MPLLLIFQNNLQICHHLLDHHVYFQHALKIALDILKLNIRVFNIDENCSNTVFQVFNGFSC